MNYVEGVMQEIIGEQLSAVTFVADYLQLHFDGPTINVYSPCFVDHEGGAISSRDERFKNRLCEKLMKLVQSVAFVEGEALTISFDCGGYVRISVADADYRGPEAMEARGFRERVWLVI